MLGFQSIWEKNVEITDIIKLKKKNIMNHFFWKKIVKNITIKTIFLKIKH